MHTKFRLAIVLSTLLLFAATVFLESSAWARAGGGRSMGSRGSRSFSSPQMPSSPSPGVSSPGRNPLPGAAAQPSGGFFSRSPFLQGLAGGLAGGMIGSLLFGGMGHAASGGPTGGGIGFLDVAIIALLLYLAYRFFMGRRLRHDTAAGYSVDRSAVFQGGDIPSQEWGQQQRLGQPQDHAFEDSGLRRGLDHIKQYDPSFHEDGFKETAQDLFFRIQAGWTNRSIEGIESILTPEMVDFFNGEFASMKQKGIVNHLENIAIRKVELAEVWQEAGKDYITILFTANLLDYTVDATTRDVVDGSKIVPVKFQEFWTFCREVGTSRWQLSAISQLES